MNSPPVHTELEDCPCRQCVFQRPKGYWTQDLMGEVDGKATHNEDKRPLVREV